MVILTKDMAVDYASQGVRVNAVCPAYIETDLNREMLDGLKKTGEYEALVKMHLLGRLGEPEDVAYATVYLVSDEAKGLSGVTPVDGGTSAPLDSLDGAGGGCQRAAAADSPCRGARSRCASKPT